MTLTRRHIIAAVAIVAAAAVIVWIYGAFDPAASRWFPRCLFKAATGLDCPGCGSQRAIHALLCGDIGAAWHANAALILSLPLLIFIIIGRRSPSLRRIIDSPAFILAIFVALIAWWIARNLPLLFT